MTYCAGEVPNARLKAAANLLELIPTIVASSQTVIGTPSDTFM